MKKRLEDKTIENLEQLDDVLKSIALEQAKVDILEADLQSEIVKLKAHYEAKIKIAKSAISTFEKDVEKYLKSNKSIFAKVRTKVLTYGTVGFQRGKKHLEKISKKNTMESITEKFFDLFGDKYVTVKKSLDKTSIVSAFVGGSISAEELEVCGVKIVQKDEPWIKIHKDAVIENENA